MRKPTISVDAVVVGQLEDEAADHVVETGAQPAAGDDADPGRRPGRSRAAPAARPARTTGSSADGAPAGDGHLDGVVEQHPVGLVDVVRPSWRARASSGAIGLAHGGLAEAGDHQVSGVDRQLVTRAHHGCEHDARTFPACITPGYDRPCDANRAGWAESATISGVRSDVFGTPWKTAYIATRNQVNPRSAPARTSVG